ncbi:hypothetical protein MRX96_056867 [Rhipicephalus microplus]
MMSHLQPQYSGLVAPVGQMPKGAERTPLAVRLAEEGSPSAVSPQGGPISPWVPGRPQAASPPSGRSGPRKRGAHASFPGIWSYSNSAAGMGGGAGGSSLGAELGPMATWVQYSHATGPQGDGLALLQHNRFAAAEPGPEQQALEQHSYHHQPQQATLNAGGLGGCPPFLNGFPGASGAMLGGAAQLFSSARVAAEAPHQPQDATPWSPHKLMSGAPGDSLHHHAGHHTHHPQQQPPHHAHVSTAKLPWQSWTHPQT